MKKAPLSIRIIHVLNVIAFWLMIVVAGAVFIFNVLTQFDAFDGHFQLRVALPVQFNVEETGTMPVLSEVQDVRIEEAIGKVHIMDTPKKFMVIVLRVLFVVVLLALFMTWKFKTFIENLKKGDVFIKGNIQNIKQIAYALLGLWFIEVLYTEIIYHSMMKFIEFNSLDFFNDSYHKPSTLLMALGLWVLADVFEKGRAIQEENKLTI